MKAPIPAELIDCPGVVGEIPGRDATAADVSRFLANNIPVLVECGSDARALRTP